MMKIRLSRGVTVGSATSRPSMTRLPIQFQYSKARGLRLGTSNQSESA